MHAYSSMPAPASAGAAEVLAEAERIVREEQDRELERGRREARRKALKAERQRRVRKERERKAAEQRERDEQLRAAADGQRLAMLERIRERGRSCGGSVTDRVFAGVPGSPRDPRGVRHSLASILLVVSTCWLRRVA